MRKYLLFCAVIFLSLSLSHAAPVSNYPILLVQPDSSLLHCFVSGDEYYNWVHDEDGNLIVKDSISGYYCYAIDNNNILSSSGIPIGTINHRITPCKMTSSLMPTINPIEEDSSCVFYKPNRQRMRMTNSSDTINNIVVFIRFSDQSDFTTSDINQIEEMYNSVQSNYPSVYRYFENASYGICHIQSHLFHPNSLTYSYQDSHYRNYYCPYDSYSNIDGYRNSSERQTREMLLIENAIQSISNQIPTSLNLDYNNDNYIDNICLIVQGDVTEWNTLLWPHKWKMSRNLSINGKKVGYFNFQLKDFTFRSGTGVLCHEFGHTLGAPDLYHSSADLQNHKNEPVGRWDIMASNGNTPQQMSAYVKHKYMSWITDIPEIVVSGKYSLSSLTHSATNSSYKIPLWGTDEFLILECRDKTAQFDSYIYSSGLVIYRINPNEEGNFNAKQPGGLEDEIYTYRTNGTLSNDGNIALSSFGSDGYNAFSPNTNPSLFLRNGEFADIFISNIEHTNEGVQFEINFCEPIHSVIRNSADFQSASHVESLETQGDVEILIDSCIINISNYALFNKGFSVPIGHSLEVVTSQCE